MSSCLWASARARRFRCAWRLTSRLSCGPPPEPSPGRCGPGDAHSCIKSLSIVLSSNALVAVCSVRQNVGSFTGRSVVAQALWRPAPDARQHAFNRAHHIADTDFGDRPRQAVATVDSRAPAEQPSAAKVGQNRRQIADGNVPHMRQLRCLHGTAMVPGDGQHRLHRIVTSRRNMHGINGPLMLFLSCL